MHTHDKMHNQSQHEFSSFECSTGNGNLTPVIKLW